jgi:gliding motility-associated-like protein
MKTLKTFWFILLLSLFFSTGLNAQNEANVWYFSERCGLDFNSGIPEVLHNGQTTSMYGDATISDSSGNLLFYTNHSYVMNREHLIMLNGSGLFYAGVSGRAIVKWPGKDGVYFIFTAVNIGPNIGLYYSIVDLKLDNGRGAVIEKEVPVETAWDAVDKIAIVKQECTQNVWVIVRKFINDAFAAFLVDENGFNLNPILCEAPDEAAESASWGYIKISYDKKYLLSSICVEPEIEVCSFNAANGEIEYLYTLNHPGGVPNSLTGIEISPDSKYLYVSYLKKIDTNVIYQFDMQFIEDQSLFDNSAILVGTGPAFGIQLARDGKIYFTGQSEPPDEYHQVSVIHKPWIRGEGCNYEINVVDMYPGEVGWSFPNILLDFLYRFEWECDPCQGSPIRFIPNFIPTPDSIKWNFGEFAPGSVSFELSPVYAFQNAGIHEVEVDVWYPSGRYEHTSREIEIQPSPQPDLGPDTLICQGASITLNANCEADFFSWSNSQFGVSSITVSDSGTYWVRGKFNSTGCAGYDTIHIGFHPPTIIDETNLEITPTTCSGASGSITGITALGSPPYAYQWLDLSGNPFGTSIDASGLPAGQYYLTITDGNGCETESPVYTIEDAGNLQVTQVQTTRPHCFRNDGQIIISAFSPSDSVLEYSIDNGNSYSTDSIFTSLVAGSYIVHIRDTNGCEGFYTDNPVLLQDIPGPQVQPPVITDETDFLGNGSIDIAATGSTPQIFFSINNGSTWQTNNGFFDNLSAGTYICIVKDENDCDTIFTIEIQNIILTFLHAITGPGGHCLGNTAMVPVNVDNFNFVADFHLKLGYNADNLECEGFANINPQLLDSLTGWVDPLAGDIHLAWNSPASVSFTGTEKVADLVFTTKNPGQGELLWYTGETESYFTNSSGNPIPAEFSTGEVTVYEPPEIILAQSKTVCVGQFANLMSIAVGNQPPISYRWIYPTGDTTSTDPFFFSVTPADAGLYTLLATDRVGCTDQKSIELIVSENPVAAFHGTDTLEMHEGDVLVAGSGLSSYLWNTGDTLESIVINAEGMYSVEMESPIGCVGTDSVYVKLIEDEIPPDPTNNIFIPNAFSPDGDGINDSFNINYNNNISPFPISHCVLHIFNRWGEEIFQSEDITKGWDGKKAGKECPGGVYVYKIVFEVDGVAGNQERVGTVMLVR